MFCNFYLLKSHKIANNLATTEAWEKISTYTESLEIFVVCLTKFENYQILFNKISHRFLVTANLFNGWKSHIDQNVIIMHILKEFMNLHVLAKT
jgi:hypothetical protein